MRFFNKMQYLYDRKTATGFCQRLYALQRKGDDLHNGFRDQ